MPFEKGQTPEGAKPFVKGKSGNPKGKPKGSLNRSTLLRKWLSVKATIRNPETKEDVKGTVEDRIALALITKAIKGDVAMKSKCQSIILEGVRLNKTQSSSIQDIMRRERLESLREFNATSLWEFSALKGVGDVLIRKIETTLGIKFTDDCLPVRPRKKLMDSENRKRRLEKLTKHKEYLTTKLAAVEIEIKQLSVKE